MSNIFVILDDEGYICDTADSEDYILEGAYLIDQNSYYSFLGAEIYACKLSEQTITTIEQVDGMPTEVTWYTGVLDADRHRENIEKMIEQVKENTPPSPQQEIETLKTENAELKKYAELISDSVVDLAMRTLKEV